MMSSTSLPEPARTWRSRQATSKQLTYGSIYTTKLLRRGIDIEQPKATSALATLTIAEVMQPAADDNGPTRLPAQTDPDAEPAAIARELLTKLVGPVSNVRDPQVLFSDEDLEHALRQLVLYGHDGLPVLSHDEHTLQGWVTREDIMHALVARIHASAREIEHGAEAADFAVGRSIVAWNETSVIAPLGVYTVIVGTIWLYRVMV
jgi:CIC family chloride channel protein